MDHEQQKQYMALENRKLSAQKSELKFNVLQLAMAAVDKIAGGVEAGQKPEEAVVRAATAFMSWIEG